MLTISGILLFGSTLYFSLAGYLGILGGEKYIHVDERSAKENSEVIGSSVVSGVAAATRSPVVIQSLTDQDIINESVYSVINLRFDNKTYIVGRGNIETLLGDRTSLQEAKDYWEKTGVNRVEYILRNILKSDDFERKIYQPNKDGIDRGSLRGFEYYEQEYSPNVSETISMIHELISSRLKDNEGKQEYVIVGMQTHLGTNGEYSDQKYIELDHDKQVIYAWENGELYKSWDASGFFDEYAVYGIFDIKNKAKNAWSPVVSKWMPNWMAFYYCKKQEAWFGIHELVWWIDEDGVRQEESSDSIGNKKSGGCVRLDRGEMIELYDWTPVGIHFLIH